ncbi:MAG: FAD:protein FMN transferase [Paracoccaceae bacterium]|nr:FAD:protein FMN transferase [Paracoccaceae bacterium]
MKTSTDTAALTRHSLHGPTMGSRWTALFHAPEGMQTAPLAADLAKAAGSVDQQMSSWNPASDLMRLNAAAPGQWIDLPPEILSVLATALRIGTASDGLFDIGVGGLVAAWGFGPAQGKTDAAKIRALIGKPLNTTLDLDPAQGRARKAGAMQLDLSGIAKGYGVDALAQTCIRHGLNSFLVGIDGEMRAKGGKPDGAPWAVALEKPDTKIRAPISVIELSDHAIATSGDYRHFVRVGQTTLSHTMNPRTGGPAQNALASVSVLAKTCAEADAWATVLMVLGEVAGPAFARAHAMQAIFVLRDGAGFRQITVGG